MASCGDVVSLEDMQTQKKHLIFEAEVITGKAGGVAGGANIDYATNQVTGQTQKTQPAVLRDAGFRPASFTFATGGTLVVGDSDAAVLWPIPAGGDGQYYLWKGAYPKTVPANSTPATSGGVSDSGWLPLGDVTLRAELEGDDGFSFVSSKPSEISGAVKRSLEDWVNDGLNVNVKWWGAKGDWDMGPAQTGTDDTAAIANAVAFLATMGSRRVGAVRRLYFPQGAYRYDYIPISVGIGFGLQIVGDGRLATYLCANQSNLNPAIDCQIELLEFKDLTLMGSLSDAVAGNPAQWKDVGFKGKNFYDIPDIDVKFKDCDLLYFKEVAQVYGRGVVFDNCGIGEVNNLLNIVCDTSTTFVAGDALRSVETGMRNYQIRNCRTDQVRETLVKVTGTGPQKEYINGLAIRSNDLVATVKLIDAPDATLRRLSIGGNTGLYSFRFGVVAAKGATSANINNNNLSRRFEETIAPTGFNDAVPFIISTTSELRDVDVSNNVVRNLSGNAVSTAGSASNISVKNNMFLNGWTYFESGSNLCHIFFATGNCPGLVIDGNQFISTVTSRTYRAFNPAAQTDKNTFVGVNPAPWSWVDPRLSYDPVLLVGGVAASVAPSARSGKYYYDGKFVHFEIMLISGFTETSGVLEVSLPPVSAIAENPGVTASYGGYGVVTSHSGWVSAGNSFSRCVVNPVTQRLQLFKEGGMVRVALGAADKSGAVTLYISGKYRA